MFNPNTGFFDLVMVGMRHIDGGRLYESVKKNPAKYKYSLVHEPNNPADSNALAVYAGFEGMIPEKLGYIKKENAAYLHSKFNLKNARVRLAKISRVNLHYAIMHLAKDEVINSTARTLDDAMDAMSYATKVFTQEYEASFEPKYTTKNPCNKIALTPTQKETKMNTTVNSVIDKNVSVAKTAAYLEAGRIANNQATKFIASKAPLMVRGYVDTPFGKLVVANMAALAASKLRADDKRVAKLTEAMMVEAWQEVYQMVDIEKMIDEMLSSESIKKALNKLEEPEVA